MTLDAHIIAPLALVTMLLLTAGIVLAFVRFARRHNETVARVLKTPSASRSNSLQTFEFDRAMEEGNLSSVTLQAAASVRRPPSAHSSNMNSSTDTLPVYDSHRLPKFDDAV